MSSTQTDFETWWDENVTFIDSLGDDPELKRLAYRAWLARESLAAQPGAKSEPVAWIAPDNLEFIRGYEGRGVTVNGKRNDHYNRTMPLYSAPQPEAAIVVDDEKEKLRAFAFDMLENFWEGPDDERQELGLKHGLLIETVMQEPCGGECSCAGNGADFPTTCYRYSPIIKKSALTGAAK